MSGSQSLQKKKKKLSLIPDGCRKVHEGMQHTRETQKKLNVNVTQWVIEKPSHLDGELTARQLFFSSPIVNWQYALRPNSYQMNNEQSEIIETY